MFFRDDAVRVAAPKTRVAQVNGCACSDRDHGGGRSRTWSRRSGQHDGLSDRTRRRALSRAAWLSANVCPIHQKFLLQQEVHR
jgi:hypothetical protein